MRLAVHRRDEMNVFVRFGLTALFVFLLSGSFTDAYEEQWGYVQVREKAHMFYWSYRSPQRSVSSMARPTILWLQGGPGGSGVGRGNFLEIGPLDVNLQPRNSTWLRKADLIFVDCPVGVGYSYVEDPSALATTDSQVAADVMVLLKNVSERIPGLQSSPLFLVGESYGGKLAAMIGVSVARAIRAATLSLKLGGVVLGDGWISPADFAVSYGPLLHAVSRLDASDVARCNRMAAIVRKQMAAGQFAKARNTWIELLDFIDLQTDSVDMENFMFDTSENPLLSMRRTRLMGKTSRLTPMPITVADIMNDAIKKKLKIIPRNLTWQEASIPVHDALANAFMKPAINEVDELLLYGINVTVYNGQLDVICNVMGVEAWVKKLRWDGVKNFLSLPRDSLHYCDSFVHCTSSIKAYFRSHRNLHTYWVLGAGHMVPVDKPDVALSMIGDIVQSPGS